MKVRLLSDRVGERFMQHAGQIVDLPADEAGRLISAKSAEYIGDDSGELETASIGAPANAARKRGRPRKVQEVR